MLLAAAVGYLLGSIPTAYWFGLLQGKNIFKEGSGNMGALNSYRVLGALPGMLVLLIDVYKGFIAVPIGEALAQDPYGGLVGGAAAVWGHCFSLLMLGQGGKGIATAAGVLLPVQPAIFAVGLVVWLVVYLLLRHAYKAMLIATAALPLLAVLVGRTPEFLLFGLAVAVPVAYRHLKDWNR